MREQSGAATGYPAAPPGTQAQQQQANNYYYPNHNPYNYNNNNNYNNYYQPQPRPTFFRRFFSALIAVLIIFGAILLIVWLVLRPRIPNFTLISLNVSSLNLSTTPSSQISGTWSLSFSVSNPNSKLHVYYDQVEARLFYKSSFISLNQLPPFDQPTKYTSTLNATVVASSVYFDPHLVTQFKDDRSKGSVPFNLQLLSIVRFKAGAWRARRRFLRVFCDDLPVSFSSSSSSKGTLTPPPKRCAVSL